jgi:hypothetical protein
MFKEMLDAIEDSLCDLASSDDEEHREDNEVTEQGMLSEDDEPGWVIGTISKTVQQDMERFRQKQMKLDELTDQGSGDAADYFPERDKMYGSTELKFTAVVNPHMDNALAIPAAT